MQTLKVACRQGASPLRTQAAWIQLSCMSTLDKIESLLKRLENGPGIAFLTYYKISGSLSFSTFSI